MIGGDTTLVYEGFKYISPNLMRNFNKAQDTGHGLDTINIKTIENITSDAGNDIIKGQWLNNVLDSGSGDDRLDGNSGNDTLIGGLGNDTLDGGGGDLTRLFYDWW